MEKENKILPNTSDIDDDWDPFNSSQVNLNSTCTNPLDQDPKDAINRDNLPNPFDEKEYADQLKDLSDVFDPMDIDPMDIDPMDLDPMDPSNPDEFSNSSEYSNSEEFGDKSDADEKYKKSDMNLEKKAPEINKVRERTFNKELENLVDRIKSNEPAKKESQPDNETEDEITEDNLLRMFHLLFYKSVNIKGMEHADISFNPFDLYKELSSDDLTSLIHNEMLSLSQQKEQFSLNEFSILTYHTEKKCYSCYENYIRDINKDNLIIAPSEELYADIINIRYGIILDRNSIERNIFYKKRFSGAISLYFTSIGSIFSDYYANADLKNIGDFSDDFFPLLIISVNENTGDHQKKIMYSEISSRLSAYFFLLHKKLVLEKENKPASSGLHNIFNFIDYTFQKYNRNKECVCSVIKCRKYINTESLFILEYLHLKLKEKLFGIADVLRVEKDKLIVFTQKSKRKTMDSILDDINKIYSDLFHIEIFSQDNKPGGNISQNIKEYLIK